MRSTNLPDGWSTVAPYAEAWIETAPELLKLLFSGVAPCAGAWIEQIESRLLGVAVGLGAERSANQCQIARRLTWANRADTLESAPHWPDSLASAGYQ